ncbi:HlyD family efflux transporter periplasmic adaptor subunit [Aquincola sp. J276]|uniref:HlyD family efflux transporter periplasmic adaptor subunit n=1 Tax=Aquincola sp. J276 TaxID=2898432 RepID=UPI00215083AA|nr:HlyD family efflux transporter periplasmic adaptor subunit [Aquincola sp. J276]MCR5868328.1 HlyD family efflux transporter periplasmic adaptor subunit [Aquincola sp. J276]
MSASTAAAALHPPPAATQPAVPAAPAVLAACQAALLGQPTLAPAARALARTLADGLGLDRVAVGIVQRSLVRVVAVSDGDAPPPSSRREGATEAAMAEALDQQALVIEPEPAGAGGTPRITLAHRRLAERPGDLAATLPLFVQGRPVAALCLLRRAGAAGPARLSADELALLQQVGALAGPVLQLLQLNERAFPTRLLDGLRAWLQPADRGRAALRGTAAVAAVALAVLSLVPMPARVGGAARVEGAVQRVLVAPTDGFLENAHARAGDEVRAGQVLAELAQQDLQLDRQRWASQLAQHQNSLAAANARRDRAQLVIQQQRAAEAEAQLALAEMKLERAQITAPFDGMVIRGDLTQQLGAPVQQGTELLTIAPRERFRVMVQVDERDIAAVQPGQTGTLALSALPWDTTALKVLRITPMATAVEGANVFEVEAALIDPPAALRPGLQGQARIGVGLQPPLWSAARRAVQAARLAAWRWLG